MPKSDPEVPRLPGRAPARVRILSILVLGAFAASACDDGGGDEGGDPDAALVDAGTDAASDDAATEGDAATAPDADPPVPDRSAPPVPPDTSSADDYTLYVDGIGRLLIYWRDASDDETDDSELEYAVRYVVDGGTESTAYGFESESGIPREGSSRMYAVVLGGPPAHATYAVRVVVRDEDGNETDYPELVHIPPPIVGPIVVGR